ncbi:hypothetical protein FRC12_021140 [Ceratobasidium sp. 428]|nr:hypothetical protein FRC12_021140 [Ceratobasidium sp. 428]
MLDLPVRLGPDLDVIRADEVSGQKDHNEIDDQSQKTCKYFTPFTDSCQVISWFASAAHEFSQEDENGGWFTSAFVKGTKRRGKDQTCRYKDLNRSIHNDLSDLNSQPNKKSKEIIEQHPKLYVSPNIANDIAEQIVDM